MHSLNVFAKNKQNNIFERKMILTTRYIHVIHVTFSLNLKKGKNKQWTINLS